MTSIIFNTAHLCWFLRIQFDGSKPVFLPNTRFHAGRKLNFLEERKRTSLLPAIFDTSEVSSCRRLLVREAAWSRNWAQCWTDAVVFCCVCGL